MSLTNNVDLSRFHLSVSEVGIFLREEVCTTDNERDVKKFHVYLYLVPA